MNNSQLLESVFDLTSEVAEALTLTAAYPGKKFTPPDSGEWLELSTTANDLQPDISGSSVFRRGIFQINVCGRPDKNPLVLYGYADTIAAMIPKGPNDAGFTITNNPTVSSLIELDDRVILPITITYSE